LRREQRTRREVGVLRRIVQSRSKSWKIARASEKAGFSRSWVRERAGCKA